MSPFPRLTFLAILIVLGAIEGLAWWWMNPAPTGTGEPVLAYQPQVGLDRRLARHSLGDDGAGRDSAIGAESQMAANAAAQGTSSSSNQQLVPAKPCEDGSTILNLSRQSAAATDHQSSISPSPTAHRSPLTDHSSTPHAVGDKSARCVNRALPVPSAHSSSSTDHRSLLTDHSFTPLPDIYRQAAPMLRCSSGQVFHVKIHDSASLHGAFFEWDGTDTGSVLEAFRHMPEACMGSIGMQLVSKEKPIPYTVGLDRRLARHSLGDDGADRDSAIGAESQMADNAATQDTSSTDHRSLLTDHSFTPHAVGDKSAGCVNPALPVPSAHSLIFDHTVFRDPTQSGNPLIPGPLVHAFRAVWVSGIPSADARKGLDGQDFDQLRTIRLKAALTRFRPTHARVVQGAVRGMHSPQAAWQAFEQHMLRDLTFVR